MRSDASRCTRKTDAVATVTPEEGGGGANGSGGTGRRIGEDDVGDGGLSPGAPPIAPGVPCGEGILLRFANPLDGGDVGASLMESENTPFVGDCI